LNNRIRHHFGGRSGYHLDNGSRWHLGDRIRHYFGDGIRHQWRSIYDPVRVIAIVAGAIVARNTGHARKLACERLNLICSCDGWD
jgi:hypothetical protein